jgi:ParB-like chromosome segregation protein Spo0J
MNAPETITEPQNLDIALDLLFPSPTNPRKRKGLDPESLKKLAQTMRPPIGILEPLVVREAKFKPGTVEQFDVPHY